ncbi:MAG: glycosyltransferase family 1 protein [Comamonadaceae bacterium]|nr:MAG: glycosyltransferase family 1 protein [Comamonadaceae bacterium]
MKIALVTDAWAPQVNGVVTTLVELVRELTLAGHHVDVIEPGMFQTRPCPGYAGIDLAIRPRKKLAELLAAWQPDAIHIATEGPLGWAARSYCMKTGLAFTTAFHTKFPEILHAALKVPLSWGYALFRHFHKPSSGVMVPTQGVLRMLEGRGFRNLRGWTHGVDMGLFEFHEKVQDYAPLGPLQRPLALFVGRVSYEKNIEAFLSMDFPGTKVVCGVGPLEASLKERFPKVRWLGLLPRDELARVYAAADMFAFPSRSETFGLVMLEAMACGTPVAAYPVDGPLEVLGQTLADGTPGNRGGALHYDLRHACYSAMSVPRRAARSRALDFSWVHATRLFVSHLVDARQGSATAGKPVVTPLSSN